MARDRTPASAVLFGAVVLGLTVAYVAIAFVWASGWQTLFWGAVVLVGLFLGLTLVYLVALRWRRGGAPP